MWAAGTEVPAARDAAVLYVDFGSDVNDAPERNCFTRDTRRKAMGRAPCANEPGVEPAIAFAYDKARWCDYHNKELRRTNTYAPTDDCYTRLEEEVRERRRRRRRRPKTVGVGVADPHLTSSPLAGERAGPLSLATLPRDIAICARHAVGDAPAPLANTPSAARSFTTTMTALRPAPCAPRPPPPPAAARRAL